MNRIIEYFVNRSLLVNLISVLIVVAGGIALYSLKRERFPLVEFDFVNVRYNYPGSSPEDVERLVTIEAERQLKGVDGIEELNALSGEGYSILNLQIDPNYEVDDVLEDVRNAMDRVTDLPEDVDPPVITKAENKKRPIMRVALIGENEDQLRKLAIDLRDDLETIKEVAQVEVQGRRPEIVEVSVDPSRLASYDMTLTQVFDAIRDRNLNISGGEIDSSDRKIFVRTFNETDTPDAVANVILRSNDSGEAVSVGDVATVTSKLERVDQFERAMGNRAIFLEVVIGVTSDILVTSDKTKKRLAKYFEENAITGVQYQILDDLSFIVTRRLNVLSQSALQGMVLVFLCLLLFMNVRLSLVTAIGAPLAFLVAFIVMDATGLTLNLISMFGLILVLGMLVDDSIIVAEYFYQHLEEGMAPREAAVLAAKETLAPVSATIVTTMIAFGSLFFMGGIMGKFLWPVPAVVIICLIASWVECFLILPAHLADFARLRKKRKEGWFHRLKSMYEASLRPFLKHSWITVLGFVLAFAASIFLATTMRFELFPSDDETVLYVNVRGAVGTPVEQTNDQVGKIETAIMDELADNELDILQSRIGTQVIRGNRRTGSHYAGVIVYLKDDWERTRDVDTIMEAILKRSKAVAEGFEIEITKRGSGPPSGRPFDVELSANSLKDLQLAANELSTQATSIEGVLSAKTDFEDGKTQILIDIDEQEARRLGVTNRAVGLEVRAAFEGRVATEIRRSDEDIDVIVRFDQKTRSTQDILNSMRVLNSRGQRVLLSKVADLKVTPGAFVIRRLQGKRTISVSGDINRRVTTSVKVNKELGVKAKQIITKYPGMSFRLSGENKDTNESMVNLSKAAGMALFCIFVILVAMFNSLIQPGIIMSAIPMGMIGVILIFYVLDMAIGFMALMGIIGLIGVVVNDSIVLVNFINKEVAKGDDLFESVVRSCLSRFRAVMLTTFTTVVGLLPIAHMPGGDPFLKPMATSFAYGLLFSTSLTLVFVPCCYFIYAKILERMGKKPALVSG